MARPIELGMAIRNSGFKIREFHDKLELKYCISKQNCYKLCRKLYRWGIPEDMREAVDQTLEEMGVVWDG